MMARTHRAYWEFISAGNTSGKSAWGNDSTGAACIRCTCGKWMLLKPEQVKRVGDDGVIELRHFYVESGGDPIGFGCGVDCTVLLVHFYMENPHERS